MSEINYTQMNLAHCPQVAQLLEICFPDMPDHDQYGLEELQEMARRFPEGTVLALDNESVVGMGTGIFVDIEFDGLTTERNLIAQNGEQISNPHGSYYYGSDMAVHSDYRGRGIAREIYNRRKALVVDCNKKGFVAAATLPGFADHKDQLDIKTYLAKVVDKELFDPTLSVQLRNGFRFIRPIHRFYEYPQSDHWAALIIWDNPEYEVTI
ncbi:MAG: GNAT family N-acetyltransferase [Chloroflexota bacterium]